MDKIYPYYGATGILDYVDDYKFDGIFLLLGEDGSVMDEKGYPILQYVEGKFWPNNHAHVIQGKNGYTVEILWLYFKQQNIKHIVTGAVQQKISQANLFKLTTLLPSEHTLSSFNEIIYPLFEMIRQTKRESSRLSLLRDTLLPRLMSGELDVSAVNI